MVQDWDRSPRLLPSSHAMPGCGKHVGLCNGDGTPPESSCSRPRPWLLSAVGEAMPKYHPASF